MDYIQNFDFRILDWIQTNLKNPFFDFIMPIITSLGDGGAIWILTSIILLYFQKTRKYGIVLIIALVLCFLIGNLGIKPFVSRTRPFNINTAFEILISKPKDFSFPSGHTMSSFAAATVLFYMDKNIGIMAFLLAFLIGFSRLYLYVHFSTDVLAGIILGISLGIIAIMLYRVIDKDLVSINIFNK